jgi:glyoxylase-like metal-dependent hydrolase (beta-lactamase superfamily II)
VPHIEVGIDRFIVLVHHHLDHEPGLVHPAVGKLPSILVEADAAVHGHPLERLLRRRDERGLPGAALVDVNLPLPDGKIEILAEDDGASILQTEARAGVRAERREPGGRSTSPSASRES